MLFFQTRSTAKILVEGTGVYFRHISAITRPFVIPVVMQVAGLFLWVMLACQSADWTVHWPITLRWLMFIAANLPGVAICIRGFWDYLIWFAALNLVIRDLVDNNPLLEASGYTLRITSRSMEYSLIWLFLFALSFIPVGLAFIPLTVGMGTPALWMIMVAASAVILGVGLLMATILSLLFAMVFQVFVFTPGSAGSSFFKSVDLVRLDWCKVLVISLLSLVIVQNALPAGVVFIFDALHLTERLSQWVGLFLGPMFNASASEALRFPRHYPVYMIDFYQYIHKSPGELFTMTSEAFLFSISYALSLPLSTCWFALLYADLKTAQVPQHISPPVLQTT